ncbi:MAG: transporter [Sporomusa sp.]|nr:transporter [Sporomusa sp.]
MTVPYLTIYLMKDAEMGPTAVEAAIGNAALTWMVFGFISRALSDRFGRQTVMNLSVLLWAVVFLLFAWNTCHLLMFIEL